MYPLPYLLYPTQYPLDSKIVNFICFMCIFSLSLSVFADSLAAPVNVTIKALKSNSAVVTWDIPEGDLVIGFAITQQVRARRSAVRGGGDQGAHKHSHSRQ